MLGSSQRNEKHTSLDPRVRPLASLQPAMPPFSVFFLRRNLFGLALVVLSCACGSSLRLWPFPALSFFPRFWFFLALVVLPAPLPLPALPILPCARRATRLSDFPALLPLSKRRSFPRWEAFIPPACTAEIWRAATGPSWSPPLAVLGGSCAKKRPPPSAQWANRAKPQNINHQALSATARAAAKQAIAAARGRNRDT